MKRTLFILLAVVVALVFLAKVWEWKQPVGAATGRSFNREATAAATDQRRLPRRADLQQTDLPDAQPVNEEGGEWLKLSRDDLEAYLLKSKRSPESLLNAFSETGDTNFLAEAAQKFPGNCLVQMAMVTAAAPEERAQWLEKLKASSPENGLPHYLSARDHLRAGNTEQALAEIDAAREKPVNGFERERAQSREEMYLLVGFSPFEAREKSLETLVIPHLPEMKQISWELMELQKKYLANGDHGSVQGAGFGRGRSRAKTFGGQSQRPNQSIGRLCHGTRCGEEFACRCPLRFFGANSRRTAS